MNGLLSVIFLADFTYRLFTAESKSRYFFRQFGWADLLASLPFEQAKILRVFRLVRVFRLLRAYGIKNIARSLVKDRAGSALLTLLLMGILVLEFGSLEILNIEQYAPGRQHHDRLRRALVRHRHHLDGGLRRPIPRHQRAADIFGSLIIIIGVGIFGTFTGYLANLFLAPSKKPATTPAPTAATDVRAKVSELKELMAQQQAQQQAAMDDIDLLLQADAT